MTTRSAFNHHLENIILYLIRAHVPLNTGFSVGTIYKLIHTQDVEKFPVKEIADALNRLSSKKIILRTEDPFAGDFYRSTQASELAYDEQFKQEDSIVWRANNYERWVNRALNGMKKSHAEGLLETSIEENDDSEDEDNSIWEPLPIQRNGQAYEDAMKELEKAIEEIRGSNGYSESEPKERDSILWSLQKGQEAIKNGHGTKNQIQELIIKPLKYLSKKFADASIGEIAKAALKYLWIWINS